MVPIDPAAIRTIICLCAKSTMCFSDKQIRVW